MNANKRLLRSGYFGAGFARTQITTLLILDIVIVLSLAACSLQGQAFTPTHPDSPTPALTSTPTTNWFPPTLTPTPFSTPLSATPTPAPPPPVGSVIYQDDFSRQGLWVAGQFAAGTIAYGKGELSLAISQAKGALVSTRSEPVLSDFYLEITATPSLCLNSDNYGVQFRMSSSLDFYRFGVSCNGQVRLERLKGGVGQVLHDWSISAQALPNSSGSYKLGVWAVGGELRLYIDDVLQFSASDASLSSGGLGLYARSMGETVVTVSFSSLAVYQASRQAATP